MRILIINTDYPAFLRWLYAQHPGIEKEPYKEQMRVRMRSLFGAADFLSSNFHKLQQEAWDVYFNNEFMQRAWAEEHSVRMEPAWKWRFRLRRGVIPWIGRACNQGRLYNILAAQIKRYKPDILLNWAMDGISTSFLHEAKKHVRLLIGQAEPPVLLNEQDWGVYDLVLAPSEGMVSYFRKFGAKVELLRFGFEHPVLSVCGLSSQEIIPVSFIGSIGRSHLRRRELLEALCATIGDHIFIWAPSVDDLPPKSPIRERYQSTAWGIDLYRILLASRITLNCHIDIAGQFADNMRLFEATGVGSLLISDWKVNLHEMFELGKEIVAYRTPEECAELIQYYLEHDDERETIARAGQQRTLKDHTYYQRMQELVEIVKKYL